MNEVLIIGGIDFSNMVEQSGYSWSDNAIDSEASGRTKDTIMRRDMLGTKRKLSYNLLDSPRERLASLHRLLMQPSFTATYLDLEGVMTKEFYCSSFNAGLREIAGGQEIWMGGTFNMTEI